MEHTHLVLGGVVHSYHRLLVIGATIYLFVQLPGCLDWGMLAVEYFYPGTMVFGLFVVPAFASR